MENEINFIPYEQALALKELGFDEKCFGLYHNDKTFYPTHCKSQEEYHGQICSAPLYQQVFKWFRETFNLHHEILLDQTTEPKYCFNIIKYENFGNFEKIKNTNFYLYRTYEEAELECIKELINIISIKNK